MTTETKPEEQITFDPNISFDSKAKDLLNRVNAKLSIAPATPVVADWILRNSDILKIPQDLTARIQYPYLEILSSFIKKEPITGLIPEVEVTSYLRSLKVPPSLVIAEYRNPNKKTVEEEIDSPIVEWREWFINNNFTKVPEDYEMTYLSFLKQVVAATVFLKATYQIKTADSRRQSKLISNIDFNNLAEYLRIFIYISQSQLEENPPIISEDLNKRFKRFQSARRLDAYTVLSQVTRNPVFDDPSLCRVGRRPFNIFTALTLNPDLKLG